MTLTRPEAVSRASRPGAGLTEAVDDTPLIRSIGVPAYDKVSEQDCLTPLEISEGAAMVVSGAIAPHGEFKVAYTDLTWANVV